MKYRFHYGFIDNCLYVINCKSETCSNYGKRHGNMSLLVPWIKSIGHSFKISIVSIKHFSMLFLLVDVLSEIPEKVGNHYIFQMKVFSLTVFSMHILLISLRSLIIYSHFIFKLNICSLDLLFHLLMIVVSFQVFLFL